MRFNSPPGPIPEDDPDLRQANAGPPRLSPVIASEVREEEFLVESSARSTESTLNLDQITIMITAQGHVKLTDSLQHTYFVKIYLVFSINSIKNLVFPRRIISTKYRCRKFVGC